MNKEKTEELLKEQDELKEMNKHYIAFISKIHAEQAVIKQTLEQAATWKSGKGQESFINELEDYFNRMSVMLSNMESISLEVDVAIASVKSMINAEILSGPKF